MSTSQPTGSGRPVDLLAAIVPVLFAFGGWQQALYLAGEVRDPARILPRAVIGGVFLVGVLYVAFNAALFRLLSPEAIVGARALTADAVGAVFPDAGRRLVALAVAGSAFGVASVCIMTAPRMYKAIADDQCFFPAVGRVHPLFGTPATAVIVQGVIAASMAAALGLARLDWLTTGVVCIDWIFFLLTGLALHRLRILRPEEKRSFRAPPVLPTLFVLAAAMVIVAAFLDPRTRSASVVAAVVMASGVLAYVGFRRRWRERT